MQQEKATNSTTTTQAAADPVNVSSGITFPQS